MTNKTADDWSNYWRGRTAETAGAALVGAGIESDSELAAFWQSVFAGASSDAQVLDLACGAGSALRHAASAGITRLAGADISSDALKALEKAVPGAITAECSASDSPFEDGMFNFVVSQFGIEYAGLEASVKEAARLLAPGGTFAAIVHMSGGGIEREVATRLKEGEAIRDTQFISHAKEVFVTARQPRSDENVAAAEAAASAFHPSEQALGKIATERGGLAAHLYQGAQQMYGKMMNYELSDIVGWLDAMGNGIDAYIGRMSSMIGAAVSQQEASAALGLLQQAGCEVQPLQAVELGGEQAAWILRAVKR